MFNLNDFGIFKVSPDVLKATDPRILDEYINAVVNDYAIKNKFNPHEKLAFLNEFKKALANLICNSDNKILGRFSGNSQL